MDRYEVTPPKKPHLLDQIFGVFKRNSPKELIKQQEELSKWAGERRLTKGEVLDFYRQQRKWRRVSVPRSPLWTGRRVAAFVILWYPVYRITWWLIYGNKPRPQIIVKESFVDRLTRQRLEAGVPQDVTLPSVAYESEEGFSPTALREGSLDDLEDETERAELTDVLTMHEPIPESNRYAKILLSQRLNIVQEGMRWVRFRMENQDMPEPLRPFANLGFDYVAENHWVLDPYIYEVRKARMFDGQPRANRGRRYYSHFEDEGRKEWNARLEALKEQAEAEGRELS